MPHARARTPSSREDTKKSDVLIREGTRMRAKEGNRRRVKPSQRQKTRWPGGAPLTAVRAPPLQLYFQTCSLSSPRPEAHAKTFRFLWEPKL